jgi:hypothetical protein
MVSDEAVLTDDCDAVLPSVAFVGCVIAAKSHFRPENDAASMVSHLTRINKLTGVNGFGPHGRT